MSNNEELFNLTFNDVQNALNVYKKRYGHSPKLEVKLSSFYHLHPQITHPKISDHWPMPFLSEEKQGLYFFFDEHEHLIYIGAASYGDKLKDHLRTFFTINPSNASCDINGINWPRFPFFVSTLGFDDEISFEAPAIREYLYKVFPDLPFIRIEFESGHEQDAHEENGFQTEEVIPVGINGYPIWQYILAIVAAPFLTAALIFLLVVISALIS